MVTGCGGGDETAGTDASVPRAATTTAPSDENGAGDSPDSTLGTTADATPDTTTDTTPVTTGGIDSAATEFDLCSAISGDEPPPDLAQLVPPEHAAAAQLILDVTAPLDAEQPVPSGVIERFAAPDSAAALAGFADAIEAECGPGGPVDGIRFYSGVSALAAPAAEPAYCESLSTLVSVDTDDDRTAAALADALQSAPPEHVAPLELLEMTQSSVAPPDEADLVAVMQALAGLGLYAEARCGSPGAFTSMLFAGALLSAELGQASQPGAGVGSVPAAADPATATAALPPGSGVAFEVVELDLGGEDAGEYLVSAVVPTGWVSDVDLFGTTFEPVEGFSVFTELSFDTGCDGMCEVTDWEARLTGPEGFVTSYRSDDEILLDRPVAGSDGIVLMRRGFSDRIEGVVLRWADGADRYFQCEFAIEPPELADAFLAACEAARPGWIEAA
jgi:hypothetical protein